MTPSIQINVPEREIATFCRKWQIVEFSLFGSVLRDDFGPASDVDVLVVFDSESKRTFDDFFDMRDELSRLFGRDVDLVEKRNVVNPFRRHSILTNRQVIYAV